MKILLTDYLCVSSKEGKPIGHGKKVLNEIYDLLEKELTVSVAATRDYFNRTDDNFFRRWLVEGVHTAPKTKQQKLQCYCLKLMHILKVLTSNGSDVIWFTNVDSTLFQILAVLPFKKKKIIVSVYRDILKDAEKYGNLKRSLIEKGVKRCNLIVATNKNLVFPVKAMVYIPDYIRHTGYDKYVSVKKKNAILCIGTIGAVKDVTSLVSAIRNKNIFLQISGVFKDNTILEKCEALRTDNIQIDNRILDDDEYYTLIGKYKYVVLPYVVDNYAFATSGVLQEAIFLGAIVIAPKQLLEYNSIQGLGYDDIGEIAELIDKNEKSTKSIVNNLDFYDVQKCKERVLDSILAL